MRADTDDYRALFLNDIPLLDARAPVEFRKGAFQYAINLPLLNDIERQRIGTCYKQQGKEAAIGLGHELVSGRVKNARLAAWQDFTQRYPTGYLYCFRGGLRSSIVQQWLTESGNPYPRVIGGYKAMRRFLIDTMENTVAKYPLTVVAGLTGTGKTEVITALDNAIDLEDCAHHRGSSFGRHATEQPSQIDFENRVAVSMLKSLAEGNQHLVCEDEGRLIGRCFVPPILQQKIKAAPLVWLEDTFEGRVARIQQDYVCNMLAEYRALYPDDSKKAFAEFSLYLQGSLDRIRKRLGGELYSILLTQMRHALHEQQTNANLSGHTLWISALLKKYYDPMYSYQRGETRTQILFRGERDAVIQYLRAAQYA